MAYQSLYRKYRSRDFADLMGQRHVTQTLANAIAGGRVSHAYLFCGPRGTGKTSTARVLAKALNCLNGPTAEPCDACPYCLSIRQGTAIDVIEIDAASNRNIDDIRQLREQVNYPPVELRYKFYIVDEVHQLTRDSFNAFLKTLEEPPGHVIFVLCTTDPHQLPATILSRCQRFDFHRITQDDIAERLRWVVGQEGWTIEEEAVHLLARSANGGLRDALSLLDQAASYAGPAIGAQHVRDILGGIDLALLVQFSDILLVKNAAALFHLVDEIISAGKDVPQLVAELIQHWRNLLRALIGGPEALVEFTPDQRTLLAQQARRSTQAEIMRAITLLCEAENELRWNTQQRLLVELYGLRIMSEEVAAPSAPAQAAAPPRANIRPAAFDAPAPAARPQTAPAPTPAPTPPPTAAPATPPPPQAAPPPAPSAPAVAASPVAELKKKWPQLIQSLREHPQYDALRAQVLEKCWPHAVDGDQLTLATVSPATLTLVQRNEKVAAALQNLLRRFFKAPYVVQLVQQQAETAAVPPSAQAVPPPAPAQAAPPSVIPPTPPPLDDAPPPQEAPPLETPPADAGPPRDVVGERISQVFAGSQEITE